MNLKQSWPSIIITEYLKNENSTKKNAMDWNEYKENQKILFTHLSNKYLLYKYYLQYTEVDTEDIIANTIPSVYSWNVWERKPSWKQLSQ